MKIGVVFPQIEFPADPIAVRDYAQGLEELGYTHLHAYDHVLGANPDRPGGWKGSYTYLDSFFEPFTLFSYLAGLTSRLEFATAILILPQRQTALVAKQAATLDVLCQGRFRLGVGNGWNTVEYTALGENFHNRGRRMEEQVKLLRLLWTQKLVNFEGDYHHILDAGINPLPIQQPIPIWFGGGDDKVLERMVRLGDGWMLNTRSSEQALPLIDKLNPFLQAAGRDRSTFGTDVRIGLAYIKEEDWAENVHSIEQAGATHLSVNTMGMKFTQPSQHLEVLTRFAREFGLSRKA